MSKSFLAELRNRKERDRERDWRRRAQERIGSAASQCQRLPFLLLLRGRAGQLRARKERARLGRPQCAARSLPGTWRSPSLRSSGESGLSCRCVYPSIHPRPSMARIFCAAAARWMLAFGGLQRTCGRPCAEVVSETVRLQVAVRCA